MKTMLRVFFLTLLCAPQLISAQCPTVNFGPDTVICTGTSITLDAGNPGATFLWNDGTTTQQLETFFEGEYSVEVTANGCVARDTIYVAQGPVIQADFNYLQSGTCSPFVTAFNEYSQACSASVTEWSWDFGDGSFSNDRNPTHAYQFAGDYVVSLTVKSNKGASYTAQQTVSITGNMSPAVNLGADKNLCSGNELMLNAGNAGAAYLWSTGETTQQISVFDGGQYHVRVTMNGCASTDTITVTSVPVLWSDFTFQKMGGCVPVKYKFTDNSSACESIITNWYWEFGDGTTSTLQNPEHDFALQAQYNVKLTVTDDNGNSIRRSKKVTVVPSTLTVNLGADTTICFGNSLQLDAGIAGAAYTWSTGETTRQIEVQDDGDYIVTVNDFGCIAKDTIHVNTSASASNKWSYAKNGDCLPVQVSFKDSSVAFCGQAIQSWHWDFGDGSISTLQHPVHDYTAADTFLVKLTVTTTSGTSSTTMKKIGVANTTHIVDIPGTVKVCTGEDVHIDAGVDDAQYMWTPAFGVTDVTARNAVIKPMINAWYYVDVLKCSVHVQDSVFIQVDSIMKPDVMQEGNQLSSTKAFAYEWYRNGTRVNGGTQKKLRIDQDGYYSVKVFNNSGCERMSDAKFFMPVSGAEKDSGTVRIKCTPNPGKGRVHVLLSEVPDKPVKLKVYDRYGRIMYSTLINGNITPVDLTRSAKGMYYIEVTINNKKKILPLVMQ